MTFIFFGDGDWATNSLKRLLADGHELLAIVLRQNPTTNTLQELGAEMGVEVRIPENVNAPETVEWVRSLGPDLNISFSYDQILRREILGSARLGFINCHAGMLPHYRGRNVLNWALINGETEIGLTVHWVDEGIDTGDVIVQRPLSVEWTDTYADLLRKTEESFPDVLVEALRVVSRGDAPARHQAGEVGTYFSRRRVGDERIDWAAPSADVYNLVRAITRPGPGARTELEGREVIVWRARFDPSWPAYTATPGEVVGVEPDGVRIKTGDSTVVVQEVEIGGETADPARFRIGTRFGLDLYAEIRRLRAELDELRASVPA